MSSSSGWGDLRIVGPLSPNREKDLLGGLKNAIERGSNPEAASKSFLNAGYTQEEINSALSKLNASGTTPTTPVQAPVASTAPKAAPQPQSQQIVEPAPIQVEQQSIPPQTPPQEATPSPAVAMENPLPSSDKKNSSRTLIIVVSIIIIAILIGAGVLGLYWDTLFG